MIKQYATLLVKRMQASLPSELGFESRVEQKKGIVGITHNYTIYFYGFAPR